MLISRRKRKEGKEKKVMYLKKQTIRTNDQKEIFKNNYR